MQRIGLLLVIFFLVVCFSLFTPCGSFSSSPALALALSRDPEVLLLDEPTSALDPETTLMVERDLVLWPCVWITHSEEQEKRVATAVVSHSGGPTMSSHPFNQ